MSRTSTREMKTFRDEMKAKLLRRALIRARKGTLAAVFRGLWHQGVYYQMRKENIVANKTVRVLLVMGCPSLRRVRLHIALTHFFPLPRPLSHTPTHTHARAAARHPAALPPLGDEGVAR